MSHDLSRKDLLLRAAGLAGGLGLLLDATPAWAARGPRIGKVYRLRATKLCSCSACHRHADNKLFATRAAAEHGRAHVGCRCEVVRAASLPAVQWRALFGSPHELHRTSVDRRRASTRHVLKRLRPRRHHRHAAR